MKWLLVLALCYITGIFPYVHGFSITAVFFFSFGAYFSISHKNMVEELRRFRLVSYILVIPLIAIMVYYNSKYSAVGMYIYPFYIIIGVIALFNFTAQLIEKGKNIELPTLTKATFFVYAVHGFIGLGVAAMILDRVIPMSTTYWPYMTLRYMLMPLLAIIICLIINALMKRFCPKILRVLTGSR